MLFTILRGPANGRVLRFPRNRKLSNPPTLEEISQYAAVFQDKIKIYYEEVWQKGKRIHIDIGGFGEGNAYSISIIADPRDYNINRDRYEIMPIFNGKKLSELSMWNDDVINNLSLELALDIARAVLSRNVKKLEETLGETYKEVA